MASCLDMVKQYVNFVWQQLISWFWYSKFIKQIFNPFQANAPMLYPLKTPKTKGFLVFSAGLKWEHCSEMS